MKCVLVASKACVDAAGEGVITGKQETIKIKGKNEMIQALEILGIEPA
jgi:hypothetical protein